MGTKKERVVVTLTATTEVEIEVELEEEEETRGKGPNRRVDLSPEERRLAEVTARHVSPEWSALEGRVVPAVRRTWEDRSDERNELP